MNKIKVLVTGGCGFIGSHVIHKLLDYDSYKKIVNLDLLTYSGHPENCGDITDKRYKFVYGSINNKGLLTKIIEEEDIDVIFHLAAESHVDRSIDSIEPFISTNIDGTRCILEVIVEMNNNHKNIKLIHISTDEVYGSLNKDDKPFNENSQISPRNPYAATKAASDHLVLSFVNTFNIDAVITRCSNNYGPRQFPEKLIPLMIMKMMNDENLPIYGDGKQIRDWIHVEDHVDGIIAVWEALDKGIVSPGEVINFGGDNEKTNLEIVDKILQLFGNTESKIEHIKDRLGHDRRYAIDSNKAKNILRWHPKIKWEDGLRNTLKWYIDNTDWAKSITSGEYRNWINKHYN